MLPPGRSRFLVGLLSASLLLLPAACGGTSHSTSPTTSGRTGASGSGRAPGGRSSVTSGPVHATLKGQDHHPIVKKNWTYTVTVTDAHGHSLAGTVATEFAFQGSVVGHETPPTHPLKNGRLKDTLQFPAMAVGYPVELQVVVHTHLGSVTLDWPVKVRK